MKGKSRARPSTAAQSAGLARFRPLQKTDATGQSKDTSNLPSGWYFNESRENEFWHELETFDKVKSGLSREEEQQKNFSEIESSANRVQELLSLFDQLDQETVLELMEFVDQNADFGDMDGLTLVCDAKSSVILNIDELHEYAEGQIKLMDSIRAWLAAAQHNLQIRDGDSVAQEQLPNVSFVFENLNKILHEYVEKSERAAFLHNDVSEYWHKQVSQLKMNILQRDEEIKRLSEVIQDSQAPRKKGNRRQITDHEKADLVNEVERQMRVIQEQRAQIDRLRGSLNNSESEKAMMGAIASTTNLPDASALLLKTQVGTAQEMQDKILELTGKVEEQRRQLEESRTKWEEERDKNRAMEQTLNEKENALQEKDILLKKYLQQLSLERSKPEPPKPKEPEPEDKGMDKILELQEEIKQIKTKHAHEMMTLRDTLEEKARMEREKLMSAFESPCDQDALKSIVSEYDQKMAQQQKDYQDMLERTNDTWRTRLATLTRQYENRIRSLNESYEMEMISLRGSVQYEVKQKELELQEEFHKSVLDLSKQKQDEIDQLKSKVDRYSDKLFRAVGHINLLKEELGRFDKNSKLLAETDSNDVGDLILTARSARDTTVDEVAIAKKYAERYIRDREELGDQHNWEMKQMKGFYERRHAYERAKHQESLRQILLKMQEAAKFIDPSGNEETSKEKLGELISQAFIELNEHLEAEAPATQETVNAHDACMRMNELTKKVVDLTNELNKVKEEANEDKVRASKNQVFEAEIERLKERIQFMESIQKGDSASAMEKLTAMEEKFREQLGIKDELISELRDEISVLNDEKLKLTEQTHVPCPCTDLRQVNEAVRSATVLPMPSLDDMSGRSSARDKKSSRSRGRKKNESDKSKKSRRTSDVSERRGSVDQDAKVKYARKRVLYNIETQLSLSEPIVEAALKSIVEKLAYRRCDVLQIKDGKVTFRDSKSVPKSGPLKIQRGPHKLTGFKEKLFLSGTSAIHRNDNFVESPPVEMEVIDEPKKGSEQSKSTQSRGLQRVRACLATIDPQPPKTIIIEASEEQMAQIRDLQRQIKSLMESKEGNGGDRKEFLESIKLGVIDRLTKMIKTRDDIIISLTELNQSLVAESSTQNSIAVPVTTSQLPHPQKKRMSGAELSIPRSLNMQAVHDQMVSDGPQTLTGRSVHSSRTATTHVNTARSECPEIEKIFTPRLQRQPIQFILPPEEEIPDGDLIDDPFTATIQSFSSNMRFIAQMKENQKEIADSLESDYQGYEAYLTASDQLGDNNSVFIRNLEDVKRNMDNILTAYDMFQRMNHGLLKLIRQSKKRGERLLKEVSELQALRLNEKLTAQNTLLEQVPADESAGNILAHIEATLGVIDQLGLALGAEDSETFTSLTTELNAQKAKPKEELENEAVDKLLIDTKNFLNGLTDRTKNASADQEALTAVSQTEFRHMREKLKKARSKLQQMQRDSAREQEDSQHTADEVQFLNDKLKEEKEMNTRALIVYQAQINTLRELFDQLKGTGGENPVTGAELTSAIKEHVVTLQTLLDGQLSEMNYAKEKQFSVEKQLLVKEAEITKLKRHIEDLELQQEELDSRLRKQRQNSLFDDADLATQQQLATAGKNLENLQQVQIERIIGENKLLNDRIHALEAKLAKKNNELREKIDELDEWHLKAAFGQIENRPQTYSRETQTTFRPVIRRHAPKKVEVKPTTQDTTAPKPQEVKEEKTEKVTFQPTVTETPAEDADKKTDDATTAPQVEQEKESTSDEPNQDLEKTDSQEEMPRNDSQATLNSYDIEWDENPEEDEPEDTYQDELSYQPQAETIGYNWNKEESFQCVESSPFLIGKKKKEKGNIGSILSETGRQQKRKTKRYVIPRPSYVPPTTNEQPLAIGFAGREPTRSIHTAGGKRQPHTTVLPPRFPGAPIVPVVQTTDLQKMLTSQKKPPPRVGTSMSAGRNPVHKDAEYVYEREPVESVIITSVEFEQEDIHPSDLGVRVQRIERGAPRGDVLNAGGSVVHRTRTGPNLEEIKKIIAKLNKKIKKLQDKNEEKDNIIVDLRKRLAEISGNLNRAKIESLKEKDKANRAVLKSENMVSRLQAAMDEIAQQQEEMSKLKREILKLKYATIPAQSQLRRMTQARTEQQRLARERQANQTLLENAKRIMGRSDNKKVQEYIQELMRHTQQTMLRNEARRKYWKEVERKQMLSVLGSLSLLSRELPEIPGVTSKRDSPFLTIRRRPRVSFNIEPESLKIPKQEAPRSTNAPSFAEAVELIGQVDPPLSDDEKLAIVQRRINPELDQKLMDAQRASSPTPITEAVVEPARNS